MIKTPYDLASKFVGTHEIAGPHHNPLVVAMLQHVAAWVQDDETAWCSAFVNFVAWLCGVPQSGSLAARSWLNVGQPVPLDEAVRGFDVVILSRGYNVTQGHVGFFVRRTPTSVVILGGNQGNAVTEELFPKTRVLGVRRLA